MKKILVVLIITLVFAVIGDQALAGASGKKSPPWKKQKPQKPEKGKHKPSKPVVKPKPIVPPRYSGRAIGVDLTNQVDGAIWRLADTGSLHWCGGSLTASVGATNIPDVLALDAAQADVSGIASVSTATASVTNFSAALVHEGVTNIISFSYAAAEARAECTSNGVVLSASSFVDGLAIDGTNVVVTGESNQVVTIAAGSLVVNAQLNWLSTNCPYGQISAAAIYFMTDSLNGPIAFVEADIKCGSRVPHLARICDKITGGGFILGTNTVNGTNTYWCAKDTFSVGGGTRGTNFWGYLNYIDHGTGMHVRATSVTGYTALDAVTRQIDYNVMIDGVAGTARVIVADNGEPGGNDIFDITLSTGYHAGGDLGGPGPGGGNIQLHLCPPEWQK